MKTTSYAQRTIAALLCALAIVISLPLQGGTAMIPFGGPVTSLFPACTAPAGVGVMLGPPSSIPLMYIPGQSYSYDYGPPSRVSQNLLGSAGPYVPCIIIVPVCVLFFCTPTPQINPAFPGGNTILFHGSSV